VLAETVDQPPGQVRLAIVGGDDDPLLRRPLEQFGEIGIDFGVVSKSESKTRLLRPRAALAAQNV
jgi:hypothetical protein